MHGSFRFLIPLVAVALFLAALGPTRATAQEASPIVETPSPTETDTEEWTPSPATNVQLGDVGFLDLTCDGGTIYVHVLDTNNPDAFIHVNIYGSGLVTNADGTYRELSSGRNQLPLGFTVAGATLSTSFSSDDFNLGYADLTYGLGGDYDAIYFDARIIVGINETVRVEQLVTGCDGSSAQAPFPDTGSRIVGLMCTGRGTFELGDASDYTTEIGPTLYLTTNTGVTRSLDVQLVEGVDSYPFQFVDLDPTGVTWLEVEEPQNRAATALVFGCDAPAGTATAEPTETNPEATGTIAPTETSTAEPSSTATVITTETATMVTTETPTIETATGSIELSFTLCATDACAPPHSTAADGFQVSWSIESSDQVRSANQRLLPSRVDGSSVVTASIEHGYASAQSAALPLGAYRVCQSNLLVGDDGDAIKIAEAPICASIMLDETGQVATALFRAMASDVEPGDVTSTPTVVAQGSSDVSELPNTGSAVRTDDQPALQMIVLGSFLALIAAVVFTRRKRA